MKVLVHFENIEKNKWLADIENVNGIPAFMALSGVEFTNDPKSDYDILHINSISPLSDDIIKQARKKGAAVIYHADGTVIRELESSFLPNAVSETVSKVVNKYLCNLYGRADYILSPTLYGKRLIEKCGVQVETLSYGVNPSAFIGNKGFEQKYRKFFGLSDSDRSVLCVGPVFGKSGIQDFLCVARILPDVRFIWIYDEGNVVESSEVRRLIKEHPENVMFAGEVPSDVYQGALSGADVFFYPSYECDDDTHLLEALASKNKVLVRDTLTDVNWLKDGINCFKSISATGFAELILKCLAGELPDISENAYSTATELSVEKAGRRLREIYEYVYNDAVSKLIRSYSNKNLGKNVLNIGLFSDTFTPDVNGVSVSVATLRTQLERMGHTVYVITPSMQTKLTGVEFENGILRIPGVKLKQLYGYRLSRPYSMKALEYIRRMNLDVIHVNTEFSMRILAMTAASMFNIPVVSTYHTTYEDYTHYVNKGYFEPQSKKIVGWYTKKLLNNKGEIVVPSEKTYMMLKRYGIKSSIHIVPTGIDTKRLSSENADQQFVSDFISEQNLEKKFRMVYIGRLAPEKGLETIINNMPEVIKRIPEAFLIVVGYGPSLDSQKELVKRLNISDYVMFCGKQPPSLIQNFYALGHVFVTASTSETQGITYIEAMAGGLPVIARYDDVLKSVLVNGHTGLFFYNDKDFIEKLCQYYNLSDDDKLRMKNEALAKAEEYSLESFGSGIINVYLKAIKKNSIKTAAMSHSYKKDHKLL